MCLCLCAWWYFAILTRAIPFTTTLIAGRNNFSIIENLGRLFLFLGPVAYMNHGKLDTPRDCARYFVRQMTYADCDANCRIEPKRAGIWNAVATKNIARGEEMTISYGKVCLHARVQFDSLRLTNYTHKCIVHECGHRINTHAHTRVLVWLNLLN